MSFVTNVMLQFDGCGRREAGDEGEDLGFEDDSLLRAKIDEMTSRLCSGQVFELITSGAAGEHWGGGKHPECDLLAAAFNYLPLEDLVRGLEALEWKEPGSVRLFVQQEEGGAFGVWIMKRGRLVEVVGEASW